MIPITEKPTQGLSFERFLNIFLKKFETGRTDMYRDQRVKTFFLVKFEIKISHGILV